MRRNDVGVFGTTFQKAHTWLNEVLEELDWEDKHRAYLALREVLHILRDSLNKEEAVELGTALPLLISGIYYEGWELKDETSINNRVEIFARLREVLNDEVDASAVLRGVFRVFTHRISEGDISDIHNLIPDEFSDFWPFQGQIAQAA